MSTTKYSWSDRFYAGLLRLLPVDFRTEFGGEMEEVFRQQRRETARERGLPGLLRMWTATIRDLFRMAPREHVAVLAQDTRFSLRMMRRNPGYTIAAVTILGLGIGVNTAIFTAVYNVLLKPLPYVQGDDLMVLRQPAQKAGAQDGAFSVREIEDYRARNRSLAGLVEYHGMEFTLLGGAEARRVRTGVVSAGFFDFFGVRPVLGRTFVPDDDRPGAPPVLVLSYEFWKTFEGGNPNIIGRAYQMNDRAHTVIGVLPPIPQYPNDNDVYMPTSACPTRSSPRVIANRTFRMMRVFGRLKPNTPVEFCRRDLAGVTQQLTRDYPAAYPAHLGLTAEAAPLREDLTRRARPMMLALVGAAAFVLLIACANVANLMLARMARRQQELLIRSAIGAGSGRLLRQMLTESSIMAILAAAAGVAFAFGTGRLLADFSAQFTARAREIAINGWALAFAAACATLTTLVLGSLAVLFARGDLASGMKDGGRGSAERRHNSARSALIAAQVAFSFVLLTGAGLMVRSFLRLQAVDPGFVPERAVAVSFSLNWSKYSGQEQFASIGRRILDRARSQPGATTVALASGFPMAPDLSSGGRPLHFRVQGDPQPESESPLVNYVRAVTPDYFHALGIPLISGRSFTDFDRLKSPEVVVLSHALAAKRWPKDNPLGKRLTFDNGDTWQEVVGIVGDVKEFGPAQAAPMEVYTSLWQDPHVGAVVARTAGDPAALAAALRKTVLDTDPQTAITRVETLEQARSDAVSSPRTLTRVFLGFGLLAVVLALAGIASMLALWVRQRRREIGIRMALGASPRVLVAELVRQGMKLALIGLAIGVVAALGLTRWMSALLFEVQPHDLATFLTISCAMLLAALIACLVPARKASRIDPQAALRAE